MTSTDFNSFTDSASVQAGGSPDFCGNKVVTYQIDQKDTIVLEGQNNE